MRNSSGRFNTSVKERISTPNGIVVKITHYNIDEEPYVDYKIRPKCSNCGGNADCVCFREDEHDDPLQVAIEAYSKEWCCDKTDCIIEFMKHYCSDIYEGLKLKYSDDKWSIVEEYTEKYSDFDDESIFCEV